MPYPDRKEGVPREMRDEGCHTPTMRKGFLGRSVECHTPTIRKGFSGMRMNDEYNSTCYNYSDI